MRCEKSAIQSVLPLPAFAYGECIAIDYFGDGKSVHIRAPYVGGQMMPNLPHKRHPVRPLTLYQRLVLLGKRMLAKFYLCAWRVLSPKNEFFGPGKT